MKRYFLYYLILCILSLISVPNEVFACEKDAKLRSINRAIKRCDKAGYDRRVKSLLRKFPGCPFPPFPLPPACPPTPPTPPIPKPGKGRGGCFVGLGYPSSTPIPAYIWIRNFNNTTCNFSYNITPDTANPPGFTFSQTSGTISVSSFNTNAPTLLPLTYSIAPTVSPGTAAAFKIEITDDCTGLLLEDSFSQFNIIAMDSIRVVPKNPLTEVSYGSNYNLEWEVHNDSQTPKNMDYSFQSIPDPGSSMALNNGTPYHIVNTVATSPQTGSQTVPANGSTTISIEHNTMCYCDPNMEGGCQAVITIDGIEGTSDSRLPNNHIKENGDCGNSPDLYQLCGTPEGGQVCVTVTCGGNAEDICVTSEPGSDILNIIDEIVSSFFDIPNGIQAKNDGDAFALMLPCDDCLEGVSCTVDVFSSDEGLFWKTIVEDLGTCTHCEDGVVTECIADITEEACLAYGAGYSWNGSNNCEEGEICEASNPIPTLSQWSLILLTLLFLTLGSVTLIRQRQSTLSTASGLSLNSQTPLFDAATYLSIALKSLPFALVAIILFSIAENGLFLRNILGILASTGIIAFLIQLLIRHKK